METKQERREQRRRNRRKMRVTGRSVQLLHQIVLAKAEQARTAGQDATKGPRRESPSCYPGAFAVAAA